MDIQVSGTSEWEALLSKIAEKLGVETFSKKLAELMQKFVHVRTGTLRRSVDYYKDTAVAIAPYAFVEVLRGGEHDFATRAINALDLDQTVTEALNGIY